MQGIWTVSELCQHIKLMLDNDDLLRNCAVKGEISNASLYPSGHLYVTLKDSTNQIAGVMFQSEARKLKFKPEEGMKVLAFGKVSIFPARSQYQIILQELQPDGVGEFYIAFQQLKEKLEKEGLFLAERKRPIPFFPRTIGIVTSTQGAALHDMLSIIERRNPAIEIIVSPSLVQGTEAASSLIAALRRLQNVPQVETIVIARGGGAPEELWAFNDETLAHEIYRCRVPVISAVGHETDFTIADYVADLRAPTPSAAAELIAPDHLILKQQLFQVLHRLHHRLEHRLQQAEKDLLSLLNRPVFRFPLERIQRESQLLDLLTRKFEDRFVTQLQFRKGKAESLSEKLETLNPLAILKRGYVVAMKGDKILKSVKEAAAGKIKLLFHDGQILVVPEKNAKSNPQKSQLTFDDLG